MQKALTRYVCILCGWNISLPFRFVLLKDLPLGMISDDASIDEAAQVELLCPKLSHCKYTMVVQVSGSNRFEIRGDGQLVATSLNQSNPHVTSLECKGPGVC